MRFFWLLIILRDFDPHTLGMESTKTCGKQLTEIKEWKRGEKQVVEDKTAECSSNSKVTLSQATERLCQ